MKIRALIVDDEPLARKRLRQLIGQHPSVTIVGESADGAQALANIQDLSPDLVFLDVQMPEMDGFEVLQALPPEALPTIVFTTAFDQHAVRAFESNALDYLVKPITAARFDTTLQRVLNHFEAQSTDKTTQQLLQLLAEQRASEPATPHLNRLTIKEDDRVVIVRVEDIDYIESAGNYVCVHVADTSHILRETLSHLGQQLDPRQFFRISRGAIVRLDRVKELQALFRGESVAVLHSGKTLRVTRGSRELENALKFS